DGRVVDRGHAGLDVLLEVVRPLAVVGVDRAGEAVVHRVGDLYRLLDAVHLHQVDGGPEHLGLEDLHPRLHALPDGGPAVVAGGGVAHEARGRLALLDAPLAVQQGGAVLAAPVVMLQPALEEALVDERPVEDVFALPGVADAYGRDLLEEAALELVVDGGVDDEVARRGAALAARAERREDGALHGVVEVGVAHDDERVLAAQLERRVYEVAPRDLADAP